MNDFIKKDYKKFELVKSNGTLKFPIECFPERIQFVIKNIHDHGDFEPQVTGSSILFTVSTIIGLSRKIIVKSGSWEDTPNLWIAVVGKRGTMKTPAVNYCIKPLSSDEKTYATEFELAMQEWLKTPKKDRDDSNKPQRQQRFSNDTTVEGLIDALQYNFNGMGIYKDELNGFFEEMSRYKAGGNLEFYLSAFSGGAYIKNRKSYDAQTINDIYLSMLGSIQPEVLQNLAAKQTENGMMDRWLYTVSNDIVPNTKMEGIPQSITDDYNLFISTISNNCKSPMTLQWLPGSKNTFFDAINEIEDIMRDEDCDPKLFTYLSKIKTYLARFVVIFAVMDHTINIGVDHVYKAKSLAAYYISTAQHTFIGFDNQVTIDKILKIEDASTPKEKVIAIKKHMPNLNNSELSRLTGVSRPTVIKYCKEV